LITKVGKEKAEKITDPVWLKQSIETLGKKGTAKLLGVDVGTIRRWYDKFSQAELAIPTRSTPPV
jgi:hypothetical protein